MNEKHVFNLQLFSLACVAILTSSSVLASSDQCINDLGKEVDCVQVEAFHQKGMHDHQMEVIPDKGMGLTEHHKLISDYVEQMAMQLHRTATNLPDRARIAVSSFVSFDASLKQTSRLGNQIAESFIHELQVFGWPVVDFKTMDTIQVTVAGDFVFSRNYMELAKRQKIDYVLAGTLSYTPKGIIVRSRIIDIHEKSVAASSKGMIPYFVLKEVY
ncbi:FlgO family outer membrane protein [Algicola sagamiensis]|uniref:FlgO family outer membrane protein n=1 Tax=Algicola sagamiensis TaxID=163869 RepID=UPI00036529C8|nr:FlgO family outer membrane protein [Algicola sagamiensis]